MSLAAAASLRMKQKRVERSPRSTAKSISPHSSPGFQVPSPRNARDDVSSIDKSPVASSPMVIATLNGGRSHYTHSLPGADPPGVHQPPHPHSAYHQHPHPPIHHHPASGSQLHHGGISHSGINSLDTSADYYVEGHHAHPLPSPTQHQQQYQLHTPGPPSPARPAMSQHQSFESATRYQGNYTHYLSPREPSRLASKPRRRYDSFTGAPSDDSAEGHTQMKHQQQAREQQAFDPFAPSPINLPTASNSKVNVATTSSNTNANRDLFRDSPTSQISDAVISASSSRASSQDGDNEEFGEDFIYDTEQNGRVVAASKNEPLDGSATPPPLMNHYDFEYHTEEDELGSALDGRDALDENGPEESFVGNVHVDDDMNPVTPTRSVNNPAHINNLDLEAMVADDNKSVDSERALHGTPIKKKEHTVRQKRRRRGHKSRIVIDNVDKASGGGGGGGKEPEDDDEEEKNDLIEENSLLEQNSLQEGVPHHESEESSQRSVTSSSAMALRRDIAAHAGRIASASMSDSVTTGGGGERKEKDGLPPRLPMAAVATTNSRANAKDKKKKNLPPLADNLTVSTSGASTKATWSSKSGPLRTKKKESIDSNTKGRSPSPGLGRSKSWDSQDFPVSPFTFPSTEGGGGNSSSQKHQQKGSVRTSKSWDEENTPEEFEPDSLARLGTWGDQTASLFNGVASTAADGGRGVSGETSSDKENNATFGSEREDAEANERALAEWDKAEKTKDNKSALAALPTKKTHPWNDPEPTNMELRAFEPEPSVFSELTSSAFAGMGGSRPLQNASFSETDDDSIFEFDKNGKAKQVSGPSNDMMRAASPEEQAKHIFSQIDSSLKQADKTKNRALGIAGIESGDSDVVDEDARRILEEEKLIQESPASLVASEGGSAKKLSTPKTQGGGKRIKFVNESPLVHTYQPPSSDSQDYNNENDEESYNGNDDDVDQVSLSEMIVSKKDRRQQKRKQRQGRRRSPIGDGSWDDNDTYGDSTVTSEDDSTLEDSLTTTATNKSGRESENGDGIDFLEHVDIGLTAVVASIGDLFMGGGAGAAASTQKTDEEKKRRSSKVVPSRFEEEEKPVEEDQDEDGTYGESTQQSYASTNQTAQKSDESPLDFLGTMQNLLFGNDTTNNGQSAASIGTSAVTGTKSCASDNYSTTYDESTSQDDEDGYLLQQALAAARATHHIRGFEFDETKEINVLTDIKFVVVTLTLPLGLVFQEHEIGVWVSRALPNGNGMKKGIRHGDQLAAINGNSSVHTTIEEVARTISSTPDKKGVELTFLRYSGPIHPVPGSVTQEGFEVTDKAVSPKHTKEKRLSLLKRLSSTPPHSPGFAKESTPPRSPGSRRFGISRSPKNSPKDPSEAAAASSSAAGLTVPVLDEAGQQQSTSNSPSTQKKKKSIGKMFPFKKKS